MKFVDSATIEVIAGKGGDGCLSFRREKYIPKGGPDGGNGGRGGDVVVVGTHDLATLSKFRHQVLFRAKNGKHGSGKNSCGKSADNLLIKLPLGTQIYNLETDELIGELLHDKQQITVAKGGLAGLGNVHFKSSVNRTPRQFTKGSLGQSRALGLELMVIADVGLLGLPNAGKSSFIRQVSGAKPKVADYPFTTLYPNLGVANAGDNRFVIADIPGLVKNASMGVGLGFKFLKHLLRTRVLLHIVDILPSDGSDAVDNYQIVIDELERYDQTLADKPRILAINKIDLIPKDKVDAIIAEFIKNINYHDEIFKISALNGLGCQELTYQLSKLQC